VHPLSAVSNGLHQGRFLRTRRAKAAAPDFFSRMLGQRYFRLSGDFNAILDAPLMQQQRWASRLKPKVPLIRCESGGNLGYA
jgi:hypothetical protein